MECANCQGAIAEGDVFCRNCGTKVPTGPSPCPTCGKVNEDDAKFCVECGTGLGDTQAPAAVAVDPDDTPSPDATVAAAAAPPAEAAVPPPAPAPPPAQPVAAPPPVTPTTAEMPATAAAAPPVGQTPFAPPADGAATTAAEEPKKVKAVALAGAIAAAVSAFLPWVSSGGVSTNALDVPIQFLVDYETTASETISAGLLVLVLAGLAGLMLLVPKFASDFRLVLVGVLLIIVSGAFLAQLSQLTDSFGGSLSDFFGFGPVITAVGGGLVISRK